MASEITTTFSLSVYKPTIMSSAIGRSITGRTFNMSGNYLEQGVILVATSATLIPVGQITAPHWAWFENLDASNFLKIRNGASGADVCELFAGEACPIPLYTGGNYYAIADTASVLLAYLIFSN